MKSNSILLKHFFIVSLFFFFQNFFPQSFTDSNLPIVVINTDIDPNTNQPTEIVDDTRVLATMEIIKRPDGTRNYMTDINTTSFLNYNGRIDIEFRGSSSQDLPKKPYGLSTLQADNVSNNNVSLLGMPSENDWILNSLAFDSSYIRDYISYNLSNQLGNYASKTVYCEVVVNGEYKGLYMLQEKLKDDNNRINVLEIVSTDVSAETITGGYITKADKTTGGDPVAWQMITYSDNEVDFIHELPKPDDVTSSQNAYIQNQFTNLQLQANNTSIQNGFPSIIDVPSFIDFMLINELGSNVDAYQISTYFHKDRSGKLRAGPVWDLNLTYGNDLFQYGFDRSKTDVWQFDNGDNEGPKFWKDLFTNSTYKCYLSKRWNELTQTGKSFNQTSINALIDNTITLITEAANRDSQKWFATNANLAPIVVDIKNFITARTTWMTTNLGSFSACNNVTVPPLVISRIHYNPLAGSGFTSNDQEFIEITNAGTTSVSLSGIYLKELGVSYQFPYNSTVSAGQKIYLASNTTAFLSKYGFSAFGQFTRNLSNKSQKLVLADAFGNIIDSVQYADASPWPSSADGTGPYLQLIDVFLDNDLASSWEASSTSLEVGEYNNVLNTAIFPNPVSSILNVQSEFMLTKIEIFEYNGRLLKQLFPNSETIQINVSDLQNGLYFVKAYNDEAIKTEKFFKK